MALKQYFIATAAKTVQGKTIAANNNKQERIVNIFILDINCLRNIFFNEAEVTRIREAVT